jgi:ABC-type transport system involved in cytochrome bd biosynthesis fused ATPase/permease subunit
MKPTIYRYRAVKPFEEAQSKLFFGRDAEINQLTALVFAEKLTVLYGKSGYGKSSCRACALQPNPNCNCISPS